MLRALVPLCLAAACLGVAAAAPQPARSQAMFVNDGASFNVPVTSMRDIPFRTTVRQQYDYSCGSAALATLLRFHYGVPVTEAELFKAMYAVGNQEKIQKVGFSLLDMKTYLAARGFQGDGYRLTFAQLVAANRPAIAVVTAGNYRHFVVVKGTRDGHILIGDPALGLKIYDDAEFAKVWNGVVFAIHDSPTKDPAYNRSEEWDPWARAPLGQPLSNASLADFTRELPPLYQVTASLPNPLDNMP